MSKKTNPPEPSIAEEDVSAPAEKKKKRSVSFGFAGGGLLAPVLQAKISIKIIAGFGLILFLLISLGGLAVMSLMDADERFSSYRSLSRQSVIIARVQANLLMTRMNAKDYFITSSDKDKAEVESFAEKTLTYTDQTLEIVTDPDRVALLQNMKSELQLYVDEFHKATQQQDLRNDRVNNVLNVEGPAIEQALTKIMDSAYSDGDAEAAFKAGMLLRTLMLARLYTNRFLIDNSDASYQRVRKEFADMDERAHDLTVSLQNPVRRRLAQEAEERTKAYEGAFEEVYGAITARNEIRTATLDRIGPEIASQIENVAHSVQTLAG